MTPRLTVVETIDYLSACLHDMEVKAFKTQQITYHCGNRIKLPICARESDIEMFRTVMNSAYEVMDRHGITAHLLNDIKAQCVISMANQSAAAELAKQDKG